MITRRPIARQNRGRLTEGRQFLPTSLSGCRLWLRADRGVTESSGDVTQWADLSGSGNHAVQTNAGTFPAYSATLGPGGRPCVILDGVNDYLIVDSLASVFTTDSAFTIIASFRKSSTTAAPVFMAGRAAFVTPRLVSYCPVSATDVRCDRVDNAGVAVNRTFTTTVSDSSWRAIQHFSSGTAVNYRNNATELTQQTQDVGTSSFSVATIGATRNSGGVTEFWSGRLWEFIVYNRELSATERTLVYNYQKAMGAAG